MSGLFKKLNTLVKATINDALDFSSNQSGEIKPGPNLEKEVKRLRERINDAIDHEDKLEAQVATLQAEEDRLDAAANDAVQRGQNETAREAIKQLAMVRKQREMAEADLRQHRHVAEELIRKVNMMEAAVADSQREAATDATEPPQLPKRVPIPVEGVDAAPSVEVEIPSVSPPSAADETDDLPETARTPLDRINKAFTDAQSQISQMRGQLADDAPPSEANVDDELKKRVSRLSKRPPKQE